MPEWTNGLAWKASVPLTGTEGSNPSLSAVKEPNTGFGFFTMVTVQLQRVQPQMTEDERGNRRWTRMGADGRR